MVALVRLAFPRLAALAALTLGLSMTLAAQTASGVITGRVTLDGEPAAGVTVALLPADPWMPREGPPLPKVKTEWLRAGRYRLIPRLPGEHWYVRAVTLPAPGPGKKPIDAARAWLALKSGERATGVTVAVAAGAAGLAGRVVKAGEGGSLPARVRLHLVPAEPAAGEELLRYYEAPSNADGTFALANLAPGRYWLLARAVPADESLESPPPPAAWGDLGRAKLRPEAEAAKVEVNLQRCQRLSDQVIRFGAGARM